MTLGDKLDGSVMVRSRPQGGVSNHVQGACRPNTPLCKGFATRERAHGRCSDGRADGLSTGTDTRSRRLTGAAQQRLMRRATYASTATALLLVLVKAGAWVLTDSISLLSTLVDSLLDVAATDLHQRTPVYVGNEALIERRERR